MKNSFKLKGRTFHKSSFSGGLTGCVAVSIGKKDVLITHFVKRKPSLKFNHEEWDAFKKGIRNGDFD